METSNHTLYNEEETKANECPQTKVTKKSVNECISVLTNTTNNKNNNSKPKERKNFSKEFKCDKCEKKYTWYSGLANHKRFVHNKLKVKQV